MYAKVFSLLLFVSLVVVLANLGQTKPTPPVKDSDPVKEPPKHFANSIGMKFVWIPPGSFIMGSPKDEPERLINCNETQHKVTLSRGFYMAVHTVTQEQWQEVMSYNPSYFQGVKNPNGEKNLPVESVSWDDCHEFIKKLSQKDKRAYRLPYEAEWEYSCRAGTTTPFYFGKTISSDQVNFRADLASKLAKQGLWRNATTPVGSFPANAWGLFDMHGNVGQWCQDWYDVYPDRHEIDPQGPNKGKSRVVRGSAWGSPAWECRSAERGATDPDNLGRSYGLGFRICFFPE